MLKADSFKTTLILAALVALGPMSTDMYLPALPRLTEELNTTVAATQLSLSIFLVGFALAQLIYGPLSDRFGRKVVFLWGMAIFLAATTGCALVTDINAFIVLRFFQALGGTVGPVLGRAIVRDIHGPVNSGKVLSHIGTAMALAPALAPVAGGYISVHLGWQYVFWVLAVYGVACVALFHFKVPESAPVEHRRATSFSSMRDDFAVLLGDRRYLGYCLSCTFAYGGLFAFLSGSSFVVIEYYGVAEQHYGLLFLLVVVGYVAGTLIAGKFSIAKGHNPLIRYGGATTLLGGGAMLACSIAAPQLPGLPAIASGVPTVILPMIIYMVGLGLIMPQSLTGALAAYPHMAGTASGLFGFIQMTVAALVGITVGHTYNHTPVPMSAVIALMGLLALLSHLILVHPTPQPKPGITP